MNRKIWLNIISVSGLVGLALLVVSLSSGQAKQDRQDPMGGSSSLYMPFIARNYLGGIGNITGKVTDALDGHSLVPVPDDAHVCYQGTCYATDNQGDYSISGLPTGVRWLTASADGYVTYSVPVIVVANTTVTQNIPLPPADLGAGQFRILVTWDNDPPDLDAHLWTPYDVDGNPPNPPRPHVFQENRGDCDNPVPSLETQACLDLDDQDGYGPETITIAEAPATSKGTTFFHYAVEKYEPCTPACPAPIQASNAVVRLFGESGLVDTWNIPSAGNPGNNRFWYVFTLEYIEGVFEAVHTVNCFTDFPNPFDSPPVCP